MIGAKGYPSATREYVPDALIILDHFHVKLYLNEESIPCAKRNLKKACQENNDELAQILNSNQRFILLQNQGSSKRENLLDKFGKPYK